MGYCAQLPACSRCERPACDHAKSEPHMLYDGVTECAGYEDSTGAYAAFTGGGGGFGGGGATGGW